MKYPHITVQLIGQNGNAFNLIGLTMTEIRKHEGTEAANTFADTAMSLSSYDELLAYIQNTVNVV